MSDRWRYLKLRIHRQRDGRLLASLIEEDWRGRASMDTRVVPLTPFEVSGPLPADLDPRLGTLLAAVSALAERARREG